MINEKFKNIYELANDLLLKLFIEKDITIDFVNEKITELNVMDEKFRILYDEFNQEFNILQKLMRKISETEEKYLALLEKIDECETEKIKVINGVLDLVIDYESIVHKINNKYIEKDDEKIKSMILELEKLN